MPDLLILFFFFFNDTATTEIYTLSLHDALPIYPAVHCNWREPDALLHVDPVGRPDGIDRKSTRLNSSHVEISYAVFCLKKKKISFNYLFSSFSYFMLYFVEIYFEPYAYTHVASN